MKWSWTTAGEATMKEEKYLTHKWQFAPAVSSEYIRFMKVVVDIWYSSICYSYLQTYTYTVASIYVWWNWYIYICLYLLASHKTICYRYLCVYTVYRLCQTLYVRNAHMCVFIGQNFFISMQNTNISRKRIWIFAASLEYTRIKYFSSKQSVLMKIYIC